MLIDKKFEEKILACFYRMSNFCAVTSPHLKAGYFSGDVEHNMFLIAQNFFKKYETVLTDTAFVAEIKKHIDKGTIDKADASTYSAYYRKIKTEIDISDWEFIQDELVQFIRLKEARKAIEDAVTRHMPKGDFEKIFDDFRRIEEIKTTVDTKPREFYSEEAIKARLERRERAITEGIKGITTGIKRLDDALEPRRGWYKRELYCIAGDSKMGKTTFLLWLANAAQWAGETVLYVTCETSAEVLEDRLDALNATVPIKDIPKARRDVAKHMMATKPTGNIYIAEYPTKTCTPSEVGRVLRQMQIDGHPATLLICDYADIMKSNIRYDSKWDEQVAVFEQLRALVGPPEKGGFDIPCITGMQVGKMGAGKQMVGANETAGAYEKVAVVDGLLMLSGTDLERQKEEMYLTLSRFRNAPAATLKIRTDFDKGRFYKEYVGSGL